MGIVFLSPLPLASLLFSATPVQTHTQRGNATVKNSTNCQNTERTPQTQQFKHGNPLQYSCLESPMDRGAWWATVHRVTQSWTQLK